jgi:hypothetical protein
VVSVPVLSEQITVVQPSVSTLGSFLTIAFRFAIFLQWRATKTAQRLLQTQAHAPHTAQASGNIAYAPGAKRQAGRDDGGEALRDGSHSQRNSNLEVVCALAQAQVQHLSV